MKYTIQMAIADSKNKIIICNSSLCANNKLLGAHYDLSGHLDAESKRILSKMSDGDSALIRIRLIEGIFFAYVVQKRFMGHVLRSFIFLDTTADETVMLGLDCDYVCATIKKASAACDLSSHTVRTYRLSTELKTILEKEKRDLISDGAPRRIDDIVIRLEDALGSLYRSGKSVHIKYGDYIYPRNVYVYESVLISMTLFLISSLCEISVSDEIDLTVSFADNALGIVILAEVDNPAGEMFRSKPIDECTFLGEKLSLVSSVCSCAAGANRGSVTVSLDVVDGKSYLYVEQIYKVYDKRPAGFKVDQYELF